MRVVKEATPFAVRMRILIHPRASEPRLTTRHVNNLQVTKGKVSEVPIGSYTRNDVKKGLLLGTYRGPSILLTTYYLIVDHLGTLVKPVQVDPAPVCGALPDKV